MHRESKKIRCRIVKKSELIQNKIECRLPDVQEKLATLLANGYTIFDMASAASGFATLGAQTAGSYVVVWKGAAASSYSVALANITTHTNVVVIMAEVNSANVVVDLIETQLVLASGDYASKLTVYGGTLVTGALSTPKNLAFENLKWKNTGESTFENLTKTNLRIYLTAALTETMSALCPASNVHIYGAYAYTLSISFTTTSSWLSGVVFDNQTVLKIYGVSSTRTFNFTNVLIRGSVDIQYGAIKTTTGSVFYYDAETLSVSQYTTGPYWNQMGSAGFSAGGVTYTCLEFDNYGVLYMAYCDGANASKLTVMKYNAGAWSVVGSAGISAGVVSNLSMKFDTSNNLYVAYCDGANASKLSVMKWSGSAWSAFKTAISTGGVTYVSTIIDGTTLSIFYMDASVGRLCLKMITSGGGVTSYDCDVAVKYISATGTRSCCAIRVGDETLGWVSYDIYSMTLQWESSEYDDAMYAWADGIYAAVCWTGDTDYFDLFSRSIAGFVGTRPYYRISKVVSMEGDFGWSAPSVAVKTIDGVCYIAYRNSSGKITVKKYENSTLSTVGATNFSAGTAGQLSLAVRNGAQYVGYKDGANSSKSSVMKYDDPAVLTGLNYIFKQYSGNVYAHKYSLNTDLILDTDAYSAESFLVTPKNTFYHGSVVRSLRNGYQLTPIEKRLVGQDIKNTGAEDIFLRMWEYDSFVELNWKIIKNLKLYDASLSAYSYNNNDNVVVLAVDAYGNRTAAIWYNKEWRRTRYFDMYPNRAYTIDFVFQMSEITDNSDFVNAFSTLTDSPLDSGSIVLNNLDNEVVGV